MSKKLSAKTIVAVTKNGKIIHFDKPVSVWQAVAATGRKP